MIRIPHRRLLVAAALAIAPAPPAHAHYWLGSVDGAAVGALHTWTAGPQMLMIISLGLLLGQCGAPPRADDPRSAIGVYVVGLLGGAVAALVLPTGTLFALPLTAALFGTAVVAGAAAALLVSVPVPVAVCLAFVAGSLIGLQSPPQIGSPASVAMTTAGALIAAILPLPIVAVATMLVSGARLRPIRIGLRIGGSWLASIATFMLALDLSRTL